MPKGGIFLANPDIHIGDLTSRWISLQIGTNLNINDISVLSKTSDTLKFSPNKYIIAKLKFPFRCIIV
jgi:hypothetical protein